ncbi:hypothetical protein [Acanthopleuribacter pedis]|uniref:Uncharacterized protein n=1 Tax=Acanthopleuribacter pedis TaxID=442870 RepID=A0A8J7QRA2_9BACT|nr:hypothetical protein [Acanthopleuribacter pedis]MBO1323300.1 hypothetical protein [Acanthopleuribacter pedis]
MKTILGFILVFLSMIGYFLLVSRLGVFQRYPIIHVLISLAGIGLMFADFKGRFRWPKAVANLIAVGVSGLFYAWIFVWSSYGAPPIQVAVDQTIPPQTMAIPLQGSGVEVQLDDVFGTNRHALIIFYRGHW